MSSETKTEDVIVTECELEDGPRKVWRALTEPDLVARWLVPDDVDCRVLEAEPERLLRCSWKSRAGERDGLGQSLDTVVTFELSPTDAGGTHLRIVHAGFAAIALQAANDNGATVMMRAA
ncbi:MAG: SRPBCC family protein [Pseudomonadota bacterium]